MAVVIFPGKGSVAVGVVEEDEVEEEEEGIGWAAAMGCGCGGGCGGGCGWGSQREEMESERRVRRPGASSSILADVAAIPCRATIFTPPSTQSFPDLSMQALAADVVSLRRPCAHFPVVVVEERSGVGVGGREE